MGLQELPLYWKGNYKLTAIHHLNEKAYVLPLHAFGGCEELHRTVCFPPYLKAKEERVEKLGHQYQRCSCRSATGRTWLLWGAATKITGPVLGMLKAPLGRISLKNMWVISFQNSMTVS